MKSPHGTICRDHSLQPQSGKQKGRPNCRPSRNTIVRGSGRRRRRLVDFGRLDWTGILAFGLNVTVDEFDYGLRGIVAIAEARLHDARIATISLFVTRANDIEKFFDLRNVADFGNRLTASMQPALLCEGDELFDDRTQLL